MTMDSQINKVHTPCKNCVFAHYDNNTQTDCLLDYISIYKKKEIGVLEAYDNEKEFYIINGKKCIGYRENKWFKQFDLENSDVQSKIEKYKETNKLDYLIVIDLKKISPDNLESLIAQISLCDIQPKKVILIRHNDNELRFPYAKLEELFKTYQTQYIWRIQTILNPSLKAESILNNIISLNNKFRFILSITDHNYDIGRVVEYTNKLVHHDLDQFEVISNAEYSCIIFSSVVYKFETFHNTDFLNNKEKYTII